MFKLKSALLLLFTIIFAISCSITDPTDIDIDLANSTYPYFTPYIKALENDSTTTTFPYSERLAVLRAVSYVRFIVNSPEFQEAFLQETLYATDTIGSYTTDASMTVGEELDVSIVLEKFLTFSNFKTKLSKADLDVYHLGGGEISIVTGLGTVPTINIYLEDFDDPLFSYYKNQMDELNYIQMTSYSGYFTYSLDMASYGLLAETIVHEMVHNMGYSHDNSVSEENDTAYTFGRVLSEVIADGTFYAKYQTEIEEFLPFYPTLFSSLLSETSSMTTTVEQYNTVPEDVNNTIDSIYGEQPPVITIKEIATCNHRYWLQPCPISN